MVEPNIQGGVLDGVPDLEKEQTTRRRTVVKLPRNLQDRSIYGPHQNNREKSRRLRQMLNGQLEMDGCDSTTNSAIREFLGFDASTTEDRPHTADTSEV
jgi:hypothetical protein